MRRCPTCIPVAVSIGEVFTGDIERYQDGTAGVEVCENEIVELWE